MTSSFKLLFKLFRFGHPTKFIIITLFFSPLFWQCISPPDYIGGDLITSDEEYKVRIDTNFRLSAYTLPHDTLNTLTFEDAVLGETFDEIFGRTTSSFLTQLKLSGLGHSYGDSVQVDSVFLFLKLKDRLGNEPINIGIYQLSDSLSKDSIYNALSPLENCCHPVPISSRNVNPYNGDEDVLKIAMSKAWADSMLIQVDSTTMSSNLLFGKHFYGLYVKKEGEFVSHAKGMYYFDYLAEKSKLVVYYRNKEQESTPLSFTYLLNNSCIRYNHFQHDFSMVNNIFNDTINPQETVIYLKSLAGSRGVIMLEDIVNWADSVPIAIHRAELRLELDDNPNLPPDTLVNRLFLYQIENNKFKKLIDFDINAENFGGQYNKSKKYYSFNITYHIQSILTNGNPDKVLYVEPINAYIRGTNAVLRSGSHEHRMKLILTYTKL